MGTKNTGYKRIIEGEIKTMDEMNCEECKWMSYDHLAGFMFCELYNQPVDEIACCDAENLSYEQELLVIEGNRDK